MFQNKAQMFPELMYKCTGEQPDLFEFELNHDSFPRPNPDHIIHLLGEGVLVPLDEQLCGRRMPTVSLFLRNLIWYCICVLLSFCLHKSVII